MRAARPAWLLRLGSRSPAPTSLRPARHATTGNEDQGIENSVKVATSVASARQRTSGGITEKGAAVRIAARTSSESCGSSDSLTCNSISSPDAVSRKATTTRPLTGRDRMLDHAATALSRTASTYLSEAFSGQSPDGRPSSPVSRRSTGGAGETRLPGCPCGGGRGCEITQATPIRSTIRQAAQLTNAERDPIGGPGSGGSPAPQRLRGSTGAPSPEGRLYQMSAEACARSGAADGASRRAERSRWRSSQDSSKRRAWNHVASP